jgi:CRP/FNR family cyclic AMP-dependent transcriptional regulator
MFEHLSDTQAISLISALEKRRFKRGEHIVDVGHRLNLLFIILAGKANVVVNANGKEIVLASLSSGECIGEMSLLDSRPHSATVVADTQVDTLVLSRDGFNSCILNNNHMAVAVMIGLVDRLRRANQKIAALALTSVPSRVLGYLYAAAEKASDGMLVISKKLSNTAISRQVGASREMVSKALKEYRAQNLLFITPAGLIGLVERRKVPR